MIKVGFIVISFIMFWALVFWEVFLMIFFCIFGWEVGFLVLLGIKGSYILLVICLNRVRNCCFFFVFWLGSIGFGG